MVDFGKKKLINKIKFKEMSSLEQGRSGGDSDSGGLDLGNSDSWTVSSTSSDKPGYYAITEKALHG